MKVICIDNTQLKESILDVGRIYEVLQIIKSNFNDKLSLYLISINDNTKFYYSYRFVLLSKFRNEKIDKLLN